MARDIRYARTTDGVSIAYTVSGQGKPVVSMPVMPLGCIDTEGSPPPSRLHFESSAMIVDYDGRGTGLSDRTRLDYTLDTLAADLDAVVSALSLSRFPNLLDA